jgi:hypothetical protein
LGGLVLTGLTGFGLYLLAHSRRIPDSDWREVAPAGEGFRVLMPGTPREEDVPQGGGKLYRLQRNGGELSFAVWYRDVPDAQLRRFPWPVQFRQDLDALLTTIPRGKIMSHKAIALAGHPGREYEIDGGDLGTAVVRIYGVSRGSRHRAFVLMAAGRDYSAEHPDVKRFLDSFRLKADPAGRKKPGDGKGNGGWQSLAPAGEGFRVLVPGDWITSRAKLPDFRGLFITYSVDRGRERLTFTVGHGVVAEGPKKPHGWEEHFEAQKQALLRRYGGQVRSGRGLVLDGHPGKEYEITTPASGTCIARVYGVSLGGRHRLYVLTVRGPNMTKKSPPAVKFFGSFRLLPD